MLYFGLMTHTIQLRDLAYRWPGQKHDLLKVPDLHVSAGERLFLMGASGSGKSTLLSLLGGVILPAKGLVEILGQDITRMKAAERDEYRGSHMGYIFQQFNLVPYLSVIDNVTLPCRFSEARRMKITGKGSSPSEEAKRLLDHLGISGRELLRKPVTELSVGQQQRVAAARALVGSPELILADEPTSSLDSGVQEAFVKLLFQECSEQHSTLVFVSHDARFGRLFDRSIQLRRLTDSESHVVEEGGGL